MQSQYKSKAPSNSKKFKKKDQTSTTTFRKMLGIPNNYLTVGGGDSNSKLKKNKSSRSRLKTVDSKYKLVSVKDNKTVQDAQSNHGNLNDTIDNASSGKKKKSSSKKNYKNKQSPKTRMSAEIAQRLYSNNRSKDFQNKVKFHPLNKDASAAFIRKSMNF